jgi:hypothetical protein
MPERQPIFELHIRPLFRLLDRQHMLRLGGLSFDLWDYDAVRTHSATILRKLKGEGSGSMMPTEKTGGPWPSEWISLFDRWIQGGFRRLSVSTAKNLALEEDVDLGTIHLRCKVDVPATISISSRGWFESESIPGELTTAYRLCVLPGEDLSTPPATVQIHCGEKIEGPVPPEGIAVIDAAGTHFVHLS